MNSCVPIIRLQCLSTHDHFFFPTEILNETLVVPFKQVRVQLWMQMGMQRGVVLTTQSLLVAHQATSVISCI